MATAVARRPAPTLPQRAQRSVASTVRNPTALTVWNPSTQGPQLSGIGKVAAVFILIMVGLDIYARATGRSFTLDLLNPQQLFASGAAVHSPNESGYWAPPGSLPQPAPPSATSPGGGGGHSMVN